MNSVLAAQDILAERYGVSSNTWSVTSYTQLRRDAQECERWNMLHPEDAPRLSYVEQCLQGHGGPVIAATDYVRLFADQIRPYVPGKYVALGTDGYGRSDVRASLRRFFEVDRHYIAVAALKALADEGNDQSRVREAIERYGLDPDKPNPMSL